MLTELRLVLVLLAVILIPGWAILAASGIWRTWRGLERWIVAAGLGVAFYPLLFYGLRLLLPALTLGPYKMSALLALGLGLIVWRLRRDWREQVRFSWQEWAAVAVVIVTLGTRWRVAMQHPYPAWTDSLHHVLLTKLAATQGRLPATLEPYFPIPLDMYHLGLHGMAAVIMWLAQIPAHTALLWTAQTLNGLCGLGVYLVLSRSGARTGALLAAAVVGLWSHQPAFYVNWGRFTQLSSQTILLIAYSVVMTALVAWRPHARRGPLAWLSLCAAMLTAGVFLLHFRVAALYLALLAPGVLILYWRRRGQPRTLARTILGTALIGALALALVLPVLLPALHVYLASYRNLATQTVVDQEAVAEVMAGYFSYDWHTVPILAARGWLLLVGGIALIIGLIRRHTVTYLALAWLLLLLLISHTYLLGVSALNITNPSAVFIMLYLPLGLLIGAGGEGLVRWGASRTAEPVRWRVRGEVGLAALAVGVGLYGAAQRVQEIEPFRFFVTDADVRAMAWINDNLPPDARFAVNTHYWLATTPHGTDAGYWLPYFTNRDMSAAVMLLSLGDYAYQSQVLETAAWVKQLESDPVDAGATNRGAMDTGAIDHLLDRGFGYVYIGARGNFEGPGLQPDLLVQSGRATILYQADQVTVLKLEPAD